MFVFITHNAGLADRLRALRNHGQTLPQVHTYRGTTGRMDQIQAAILSEKLKLFDTSLETRRRAASFYLDHLRNLSLQFPQESPGCASFYYLP